MTRFHRALIRISTASAATVRKTDQQLQRMDIHIHSSIAVTFESRDCLAEFIFNLRALAEELTQVADSLQSDGEDD